MRACCRCGKPIPEKTIAPHMQIEFSRMGGLWMGQRDHFESLVCEECANIVLHTVSLVMGGEEIGVETKRVLKEMVSPGWVSESGT